MDVTNGYQGILYNTVLSVCLSLTRDYTLSFRKIMYSPCSDTISSIGATTLQEELTVSTISSPSEDTGNIGSNTSQTTALNPALGSEQQGQLIT